MFNIISPSTISTSAYTPLSAKYLDVSLTISASDFASVFLLLFKTDATFEYNSLLVNCLLELISSFAVVTILSNSFADSTLSDVT